MRGCLRYAQISWIGPFLGSSFFLLLFWFAPQKELSNLGFFLFLLSAMFLPINILISIIAYFRLKRLERETDEVEEEREQPEEEPVPDEQQPEQAQLPQPQVRWQLPATSSESEEEDIEEDGVIEGEFEVIVGETADVYQNAHQEPILLGPPDNEEE